MESGLTTQGDGRVGVTFFGRQPGRKPWKLEPLSNTVRACAGLLGCLAVLFACTGGAQAQGSAPPLNAVNQIGGRIAQCWHAPRTGAPQIIEVTVRLRFSREGALIGEPRAVYIHAAAEPGLREKITASIVAAVKACTPLPFTPSLGASIAGRMIVIRLRSLPASGQQQVI